MLSHMARGSDSNGSRLPSECMLPIVDINIYIRIYLSYQLPLIPVEVKVK